MNTMVGMQTSLHTPNREDSLQDLMQNGSDDDDDMGALGTLLDDDVVLHDDFNADDLLMSPLFNDSAGKLDQSFNNLSFSNEHAFGQFEEPAHDTLLGTPPAAAAAQSPMPPATQGASTHMNVSSSENLTNSPANRPPARLSLSRESRTVKLPGPSAMQAAGLSKPPALRGMSNMPTTQLQSSFASFNTTANNSSSNHMSVPSVIGGSENNFREVADDSSIFDQSQSGDAMQDYSTQSAYRSPTRRIPERSISGASSSESPVMGNNSAMFRQGQPPQQALSLTPGNRSLPPKAQSYAPGMHASAGLGGAPLRQPSNDLSMMRQQLQRMRELDIRDTVQHQQHQQQQQQHQQLNNGSRRTSDSSNMSRSAHHVPVQRTVSASAGSQLSRSMHFGDMQRSAVVGQMPGAPPFGNVSIASDSRSFKPSFNNRQAMSAAASGANTPGGAPPGAAGGGGSNVNEAMEKLCESMKRSAMSRSLVKQYSSGARGVSRQGSGSLFAMRQAATGRNSVMDDSSGRSAPIRRLSSTKHHLQHPNGRGVARYDSGRSISGASGHNINLQFH